MIPTMAEVKARKIATICKGCGQSEYDTRCEVKDGYHLHCAPHELIEEQNAKINAAAAAASSAALAALNTEAASLLAAGYRATQSATGLSVWFQDPRKGKILVGRWEEKRTGETYNLYGDKMSEFVGTYGLLPTMPIPFRLDVALRLATLTEGFPAGA